MNINLISATYDTKVQANRVNAEKKGTQAKAPETKGEKVEFSGTKASENSEADMVKSAAGALPDVRIEMVEDIKRRIKSNDYPIKNNFDEALKKLMQSDLLVA